MAVAKVVLNGFESVLKEQSFPGTWYVEGTQHPYQFHGYYGRVLWCGLWDFHRDKFAVRVGPINVDKDTAFSTFPLEVQILEAYKHLNIKVRGIKDPTYVVGAGTKQPSYQQKTTAEKNFNTGAWDGENAYERWVPTQQVQIFELNSIATELAAHPNWVNGGYMTFVFDFIESDFSGFIRVPSMTFDTQTPIQVDYASSDGTSIVSVSGDDKFSLNEKNIPILTTGGAFAAESLHLLDSAANKYPQTIASNDGTTIKFNVVNTPAGLYTLKFSLYGETFTHPVEVTAQPVEQPTVEEGVAGVVMDCFEYYPLVAPGPVEQVTGSADSNTSVWQRQVIVGKWGTTHGDIAFKTEEIFIAQGSVIEYFDIELPVVECYKRLDYELFGVADPTAPIINNSNKPSSQGLTTASVAGTTSTLGGYAGTERWTPTANPVILDAKAVAQELVDAGNWFSGAQPQFVIKHDRDLGGQDGYMRIRSNENVDDPKILIRYGVSAPKPEIYVVGEDNAINVAETNVLCPGNLLNEITSIQIEQGNTVEVQTITVQTSTKLAFDFAVGNLVVGQPSIFRYFDASGEVGFLPITINTAGGAGSGTVEQDQDGHEYADPKPSSSLQGTWEGDWEGTVALGTVFYYNAGSEFWASATFSNLPLPIGSTLDNVSLQWASTGQYNAYKVVDFEIRAVLDNSTGDLGPSNLPSEQTLTNAAATVVHTDFPSYNNSDYWEPDSITIDLTAVVQEAVGSVSWTGDLRLVMIPTYYQYTEGYITFNATESSNPKLSLSFNAGSAVKISNVNGDNTIRHGDTDLVISANDTTGAANLKITQDGKQVSQTIKSNSGTQIVFDFARGILGNGNSTLSFEIGGEVITKTVRLLPKAGWDYITLTKVGLADDSLCYQSDPQCSVGDQFEFNLSSANGFGARVRANGGQPYIIGGDGPDTMNFNYWRSDDGVWTYNVVAFFEDAAYLNRHKVQPARFEIKPKNTAIEPNTTSERWIRQDDSDADESWSDNEH